MKGRLLFLGTGSSVGVPLIGCQCPICSSPSPFNKRYRSSILIRLDGKTLLVDTCPDFRIQALQYDIRHLDGVMISHAHQDHVGGIDDLRPFHFFSKRPVPLLLSRASADDIRLRFSYLFKKPHFDLHILPTAHGEVFFQGIKIRYLSYKQAGMTVTGFIVGSTAYLTDIHEYDPSIFESLKGINTLIISALRFAHSEIHLSIDDAIAFSKRVGAPKTWLNHLSHDLDYEKTNAYLPDNIRLAYDGLEIDL